MHGHASLLLQEAGARLLREQGNFMFINKNSHQISEMLRANGEDVSYSSVRHVRKGK